MRNPMLTSRNMAVCLLFVCMFSAAFSLCAQGPAMRTQPATAPATVPAEGLSRGDPAQFQGSVTSGQASSTPIALSLQDAIDRGLKNNLGLLVSDTASRQAHAERVRALSALLPLVTGGISETAQQFDLASFGFRFPGVPSVVGPFGFTDLR